MLVRSRIPQTRTRESARESPSESKCQIWSTRCFVLSRGAAMRRRSRAGGEPTKAQHQQTAARKSRIAPKAVRSRKFEATKVARLTRERKRGVATAGRDSRGTQSHQPLDIRSAKSAQHTD